jgi:hypothetical protein
MRLEVSYGTQDLGIEPGFRWGLATGHFWRNPVFCTRLGDNLLLLGFPVMQKSRFSIKKRVPEPVIMESVR